MGSDTASRSAASMKEALWHTFPRAPVGVTPSSAISHFQVDKTVVSVLKNTPKSPGLDSRSLEQAYVPYEGNDSDSGAGVYRRLPGHYRRLAIPQCGRGCWFSHLLAPRRSKHAPIADRLRQDHARSIDWRGAGGLYTLICRL